MENDLSVGHFPSFLFRFSGPFQIQKILIYQDTGYLRWHHHLMAAHEITSGVTNSWFADCVFGEASILNQQVITSVNVLHIF